MQTPFLYTYQLYVIDDSISNSQLSLSSIPSPSLYFQDVLNMNQCVHTLSSQHSCNMPITWWQPKHYLLLEWILFCTLVIRLVPTVLECSLYTVHVVMGIYSSNQIVGIFCCCWFELWSHNCTYTSRLSLSQVCRLPCTPKEASGWARVSGHSHVLWWASEIVGGGRPWPYHRMKKTVWCNQAT